MAKKTATKTEQKVKDEVVEDSQQTKKVAPKKTTTKKETVPKKQSKEVVKEDDEDLLEEEEDSPASEGDSQDSKEKKKRVAPTRESVLASFDELIESVEKEIGVLRDSQNKTKGVKFLRTLGKRLKGLKSQSTRIISKRNPSQRKTGTNVTSGFLKPVSISKEIAKFTGWGTNEKKSRVDVTKFLCNYIREHNLQNEKDKRQIKPDAKLSKLLNYDEKTSEQPLTYFHLQRLLKTHFPKDVTVTA